MQGKPIRFSAGSITCPADWEVVRRGDEDARTFAAIARVEGGYVLRLHDLVDFFIDGRGDEIRYAELADLQPGVLEQLFVDQALPHALSLRGHLCLHASAVLSPTGDAVAFVGPSGFGKSTLAYELSKSMPFLTDDCLRITFSRGVPVVHPGEAATRLWGDSATALVSEPSGLDRVTPRTDKLRVPVALGPAEATLARIYIIDWDPAVDEGISIRPMKSADAIMALAAQQFRIDVSDKRLLSQELDGLAKLVGSVRVRRLAYPHDYELLGAVRTAIVDDLDAP